MSCSCFVVLCKVIMMGWGGGTVVAEVIAARPPGRRDGAQDIVSAQPRNLRCQLGGVGAQLIPLGHAADHNRDEACTNMRGA